MTQDARTRPSGPRGPCGELLLPPRVGEAAPVRAGGRPVTPVGRRLGHARTRSHLRAHSRDWFRPAGALEAERSALPCG